MIRYREEYKWTICALTMNSVVGLTNQLKVPKQDISLSFFSQNGKDHLIKNVDEKRFIGFLYPSWCNCHKIVDFKSSLRDPQFPGHLGAGWLYLEIRQTLLLNVNLILMDVAVGSSSDGRELSPDIFQGQFCVMHGLCLISMINFLRI